MAEPKTQAAPAAAPKPTPGPGRPARKLRIHLHVAAAVAPAPHMVSGEVKGGDVEDWKRVFGPIGEQGRANVMACNPRIVQGEWDRGTGEWWNVRCEECYRSEAFKAAQAAQPHPFLPADVDDAPIPPPPCC